MLGVIKIIFVHANVEHLYEVSDQSTMDKPEAVCVIGTNKNLKIKSINKLVCKCSVKTAGS